MEKYIAVLTSLMNTATALRSLNVNPRHKDALSSLASEVTNQMRQEILDIIDGDDLSLTMEEREMIMDDAMIPAIKSIRSRLGCSLKEGKDKVDKYRDKYMILYYDEALGRSVWKKK